MPWHNDGRHSQTKSNKFFFNSVVCIKIGLEHSRYILDVSIVPQNLITFCLFSPPRMVCHLLRTPTYSTGTLWTVARSPWKLSSSYLHFCSSTQITCTSTEATMRITSWTWGSIVTSLPSSCSYSQLCAVLNNHKKYLKDLLLLLFQIWLYKRSNAEVQGNIIFATRWLLLEFHTWR